MYKALIFAILIALSYAAPFEVTLLIDPEHDTSVVRSVRQLEAFQQGGLGGFGESAANAGASASTLNSRAKRGGVGAFGPTKQHNTEASTTHSHADGVKHGASQATAKAADDTDSLSLRITY